MDAELLVHVVAEISMIIAQVATVVVLLHNFNKCENCDFRKMVIELWNRYVIPNLEREVRE